ncbi:MAG: hypothetical protein GY808_03410 [Gammaproteobacteria bacterium]|nr:hypothetical protein [Gammaproteobacteria bacterium]
MNEPGALDERLRTLVMQSFEGGGERLLGTFTLNSLPAFTGAFDLTPFSQ